MWGGGGWGTGHLPDTSGIGVGTGGATGAMAPHFLAKIILKIFPSFTILTRKTIHQDQELRHPPNIEGDESLLESILSMQRA